MKTEDKIIIKSCINNIKSSKHSVWIFINCLLVTFSLFFCVSAFNFDNHATFDNYVENNKEIIGVSRPKVGGKRLNDHETFKQFEKVYFFDSYQIVDFTYIEYNEQVGKLFSLDENFNFIDKENKQNIRYFPVAISDEYRNDYYKSYKVYLNVGDSY